MLEAVDSQPRSRASPVFPPLAAGNLELVLAGTPEELQAAQRLRYVVFSEEMDAVFKGTADGIDADEYDPWCKHLLVREQGSGEVVGTYRILTPANAAGVGGFYSESEFDLSSLAPIRHQVAELGRSCIRADYRNGGVIMLLWAGIAAIVKRLQLRYVLGCASVSLRDGGVTAAHVWHQAKREMAVLSDLPQLRPHCPYPVSRHPLDADQVVRTPALIKGYLKAGAHICGEPAWDPDFNAADFPVFLDVERMDERYRRHFGIG